MQASYFTDKVVPGIFAGLFIAFPLLHSFDWIDQGESRIRYEVNIPAISDQPHIETGGTYNDLGPVFRNVVFAAVSGTANINYVPNVWNV